MFVLVVMGFTRGGALRLSILLTVAVLNLVRPRFESTESPTVVQTESSLYLRTLKASMSGMFACACSAEQYAP